MEEVGAVDPHAMQNDGELPGQCHGGTSWAAALGDGKRPASEEKIFTRVRMEWAAS